jgi:histidinol dehydrogenase
VLRTLDLRQAVPGTDLASVLPRAELDVEAAVEWVRPMVADVAHRGAAAILDLSEQWDGVRPAHLRVPVEELARAEAELDPGVRAALLTSIERRRAVAAAEVGPATERVEVAPGAVISQRMVPVDRVGLYVPGGLAPLASSVIMNVVPAQAAGVPSLAVTSPPQKEFGGLVHPTIMATCHLLGVTEVYAVGGPWAVAMLAYGVPELCERVTMITGPGNVYVTAAKRLLKGVVGIDAENGTTEIAILADDTADPVFVAADLISQAEHDPAAAAVLVTASTELVDRVQAELEVQVPSAKHAERITQALGGPQSAIVLVDDLEAGIAVVDAYAAEHLEIHTADAATVAGRIRNAGAIFVGSWSPVSLGDYCAGSTHVLPTGGCACHSSGLNAKTFLKQVHVIDYSADALRAVGRAVEVFAEAEDLPSHGRAVSVRLAADRTPSP